MTKVTSKARGRRVVGQTQRAGFQIGARRTLPIALEEAWQLLIAPEGMRLWLGGAPQLKFEKGETYTLRGGAQGEVRVFEPNHHLRLTWHPPGWPGPSTIQIRVIPNGRKTTIAFHQEHLPDSAARAQQRAHFESALDSIERMIK